jgi:cytochrome c oxidase assembly protein subunit 15
MHTLARISLILVLVLVTLSAYLRLDHSGIGCEPWPACYGNIGIAGEAPGISDTYERLKSQRLITLGLLALTVFLAWLGIYSEGLHSPAVVMGNLGGGFAMLGLLGWMVLRKPNDRTNRGTLRTWAALAIVTLSLQIFLGGLTSANFAASACQTIPDCHGSWLPGAEIATAFDLSRTHEIGATGMVLGGAERAAIHKLHRNYGLRRHGTGQRRISTWRIRHPDRITHRACRRAQLARSFVAAGVTETSCGSDCESK